eukprot:CAMPEP_0118937758 /NCGR_PEP_ID=MMETSP1169-20130426/23722_1 /TAXON_ID=36882 /ORGANISM="Pyramimonas obovata, Strain CCMP722" /LENGTH=195 /DNA_ID=CAMNT_0006881491 /DNA_START=106 /DNA_END=691 /DNA_ORIENTATION=+
MPPPYRPSDDERVRFRRTMSTSRGRSLPVPLPALQLWAGFGIAALSLLRDWTDPQARSQQTGLLIPHPRALGSGGHHRARVGRAAPPLQQVRLPALVAGRDVHVAEGAPVVHVRRLGHHAVVLRPVLLDLVLLDGLHAARALFVLLHVLALVQQVLVHARDLDDLPALHARPQHRAVVVEVQVHVLALGELGVVQ